MFEAVFSDFERLAGERPRRLLDRHPDGSHVALQVWGDFAGGVLGERAGVWETTTKRLVWEPGNASALAWFPGGREIAAVTQTFTPKPAERGIIVTPLQSEFDWSFERRSWPDGDVTTACAIRSPTGWFDGVVVSPRTDVAAARWADQGEAGFVLVDVRDGGAAQIEGAEWETRETNWIEGPTFSPDGGLLAVSLNPPGAGNWWGGEDDAEPSPGGRFAVGEVVVLDRDLRERHRERVEVEVPEGWHGGDDDETRGLGQPRFEQQEVVVAVPLEGDRSVRI